jgi:hypothetical protein
MMRRQINRISRKGREAVYSLRIGFSKRMPAMNRFNPTGGVE